MKDLIVVGAGPAGLTAALFAAKRGLKVTVLEHAKSPLRKLLISGKGRCNLTNDCSVEDYRANVVRGAKFLYSSAAAFGPADVMEMFRSFGVPLKTERGGRVFPESDSAADIADALLRQVKAAGVHIESGDAVGIDTDEGRVSAVVLRDGRRIPCRAALLACGGKSYPGTGSDGSGFKIAEALGHTIKAPAAALVPIVCAESWCGELEGLSLRNVTLTAKKKKKTLFSEQGEMLFTSFGISGPLVLSMSSYLAREDLSEVSLYIDLKPALSREQLDARLLRDFAKGPNREFKNSLSELLPKKLIPVVVELSNIPPELRLNSLKGAQRVQLLELLKALPLTPVSPRPIAEAIVTAGGVATKEIDPATMQSKIVENLYFAGEIIDVDALTGGYNLTIAFSTGRAAGANVLKGE